MTQFCRTVSHNPDSVLCLFQRQETVRHLERPSSAALSQRPEGLQHLLGHPGPSICHDGETATDQCPRNAKRKPLFSLLWDVLTFFFCFREDLRCRSGSFVVSRAAVHAVRPRGSGGCGHLHVSDRSADFLFVIKAVGCDKGELGLVVRVSGS